MICGDLHFLRKYIFIVIGDLQAETTP